MTDLLPCPFCGGKATALIRPRHSGFFIRCTNLECASGDVHGATATEAIAAWNTRAPVEIKPLEWAAFHRRSYSVWTRFFETWEADYMTIVKQPGPNGRFLVYGMRGPAIFFTLEEAKAAAQADHERRIRGCLK